jgi:hypothetical protein
MRGVWFACFLVACSGGGGSDSGSSATSGDDDDGLTPMDCNAYPQFDLSGMDCVELGVAFGDQVDAATECEKPEDCRTIHPECDHWDQVFCYYAVNCKFPDAVLTQYNTESAGCVVVDGVRINACECPASVPSTCMNGKCVLQLDSTP